MIALRTSCQQHCSCSSRAGRAAPPLSIGNSAFAPRSSSSSAAAAAVTVQSLLPPSSASTLPASHLRRAHNNATRCSAAASDPPKPDAAAAADAAEDGEDSADGSQPTVVLCAWQVEGFDGLPVEEDAQVPGTYSDALNGNTRLGKAVRAACSELEYLNDMELQMLQQADDLLKKLGFKQPLITKQEESEEQEPQA